LPDFNDIEGTIAEIKHIFETEKKANGVVIMSSYGNRLVGDDTFIPIWDELNKHSALVFLHPSHIQITPEKIGGFLPQPVIDYPLATTRAAMSLLVSGIMTQCAQIEVILSHAGGAFPMLAQRGIGSLANPAIAEQSKVNILQAYVNL
jgi:6-methylsalicylate decarboxylase